MRDSTAAELLPIMLLAQKGLTAKASPTMYDRLFEDLIFEGMKGIVIDENADGSLSWQQMGHPLDHIPQLRFRGMHCWTAS